MSWLWLKGELIHCSECDASEKIIYEDAPRDIQVGDFNVILQRELNEAYGGTGDGLTRETAVYFHVVGICEKCLQKIDVNAYYIPDEDLNYTKFLETYDLLFQNFSDNMTQTVKELLNSVQGNLFDEMIKKAIENNLTTENNQHKHPKQIMSERKQYIMKRLATYFEKFAGKFVLEENAKNDFLEFRIAFQQYLNTYPNDAVILRPYDYANIRSLNPFISYPESRAKPLELNHQPLKLYIEQGYSLDECRTKLLEQIDHNIRKIKKSIRKAASSKFADLEDIFMEFGIDINVLNKERKVYTCLVEGDSNQAIIQCNECGIAYRKSREQPFERIPSGAIESVLSQHSKYINCVCDTCFNEIKVRQSKDDFIEIRNQIKNIEEKVIPKYLKSVKQHYENYVLDFSEYDFEALKSGKSILTSSENEIVEFLEKRKNKIIKNADGYVRSKIKVERNELVAAVKNLYAKYCAAKEGSFGLYELYESDAKTKSLRVNENSFYPYKKFMYKDDYRECLDFDLSKIQERCYESLLGKVMGMVLKNNRLEVTYSERNG